MRARLARWLRRLADSIHPQTGSITHTGSANLVVNVQADSTVVQEAMRKIAADMQQRYGRTL